MNEIRVISTQNEIVISTNHSEESASAPGNPVKKIGFNHAPAAKKSLGIISPDQVMAAATKRELIQTVGNEKSAIAATPIKVCLLIGG
jgi:hypothetical protein